MAASTGARLQRKAARTAVSAATAPSFRRCYGIQFTFPQRYADGPTAPYVTHMFDMRCQENGIEHRLTKVKHPWTTDVIDKSFFG